MSLINWKPVVGYEGLYEVSDTGQVRSNYLLKLGRNGGILKTWVNHKGYVEVMLSKDNVKKSFKIHHLVLNAFVGERPEGYECNHDDGDKANNHLYNIEWNTKSFNASHRDRTGLGNKVTGDRHWTRLHPEKVAEVITTRAPATLPKGDDHWTHKNPERLPTGESHPMSKLSSDEIAEMRRLRAEKVPVKDIAKRFSTEISYVYKILKGKNRVNG